MRDSDGTQGQSLIESLRDLEHQGYTENFAAVPGGVVRCESCDAAMPAADLEVGPLFRTEGESDPGDMSAVLGLTCPRCGAQGVLIVRYGPEADQADAEVLTHLSDLN